MGSFRYFFFFCIKSYFYRIIRGLLFHSHPGIFKLLLADFIAHVRPIKVPHTYATVRPDRHDLPLVRTPLQTKDVVGMTDPNSNQRFTTNVIHLGLVVFSANGDVAPRWRHGNAVQPHSVRVQYVLDRGGLVAVPEQNPSVGSRGHQLQLIVRPLRQRGEPPVRVVRRRGGRGGGVGGSAEAPHTGQAHQHEGVVVSELKF